MGVDGLTNSFAAALWAIDMSLEAAYVGVWWMNYLNPIEKASYQSILGQAPLFGPTPTFQALLLTILGVDGGMYIEKPTITAGTSANIKVFGLQSYWGDEKVMIINKDTNPSANGYVSITLATNSNLRCFYLTASSLDAKSSTLAGLNWISNTSAPQGAFSSTTYHSISSLNGDWVYQVYLNYSQAVMCRIEEPADFTQYAFPTCT